MPVHLLTNFEVQKYYQNEPKFGSVYSRNNLPKIKYGTYLINLHQYNSKENHWLALYVNGDSFAAEPISKKIKKFTDNKYIPTNIHKIQANDSIICGYFCIGFINFVLKGNTLLDYTSLFSLNKYEE